MISFFIWYVALTWFNVAIVELGALTISVLNAEDVQTMPTKFQGM